MGRGWANIKNKFPRKFCTFTAHHAGNHRTLCTTGNHHAWRTPAQNNQIMCVWRGKMKRTYRGSRGIKIVNGARRVSRRKHVKTITSKSEFTLKFQIKPMSKQGGWRSIVHFAEGNGRLRIPAIWFYSGTTRLHVRMARPGHNNDGCDPGQQLPLRRWTRVKVQLRGRYLSVYYNGRRMCRNG